MLGGLADWTGQALPDPKGHARVTPTGLPLSPRSVSAWCASPSRAGCAASHVALPVRSGARDPYGGNG